jgi:hypothetical protein
MSMVDIRKADDPEVEQGGWLKSEVSEVLKISHVLSSSSENGTVLLQVKLQLP